jgi:hypothetical protein
MVRMLDSAPLVAAIVAALATIALQLADAVTGSIEARAVRDDDEPESFSRSRARELTWTVAVTALIAVLVAFGVDVVARSLGDLEHVAAGVGLLALVALATFGVGLVGAIAAIRRERPAYARLRRDLRDRATLELEPGELESFEVRLARADRMRERPLHAASVLRVVGLVVVLGVATTVLVQSGELGAGAVAIALVGVVLSIAAFAVSIRADVVRRAALDAVHEAQRADVLALLERARIPRRQHVPGLRDRVSRALAILREQQR